MRLWSIHPGYLDTKGLVALWREGLLAQSVLRSETRGYRHHPQLARCKDTADPTGAVGSYLRHVADEAHSRNYNFDKSKILNKRLRGKILVTTGQLEYEFQHLLKKLKIRDLGACERLQGIGRIEPHALFDTREGGVEDWEVVTSP